jgi:hypothetical protein
MPFADHLASRAWSQTIDERRTVQVWRRHDGKYRVVELHRIGESSRYREARGETFEEHASALAQAKLWADHPANNGHDALGGADEARANRR